MARKLSTQRELLLTDVWHLIMSDVRLIGSFLTLKIFYHQVIADLPKNATEKVRLLKKYEIWVCVWKITY